MVKSVPVNGKMERILNLIANRHFMQGTCRRPNIWWITCARVWSSLWCVGSTLNQRMMQIQGDLLITE